MGASVGGGKDRVIREISALSAQLFYNPKTALKIKSVNFKMQQL